MREKSQWSDMMGISEGTNRRICLGKAISRRRWTALICTAIDQIIKTRIKNQFQCYDIKFCNQFHTFKNFKNRKNGMKPILKYLFLLLVFNIAVKAEESTDSKENFNQASDGIDIQLEDDSEIPYEDDDDDDEDEEEPDLNVEIFEDLVIDFEEGIKQTDTYVSLPYFRVGEWDQPVNIKTIDELFSGFEGQMTPTILLIYDSAAEATKIINELMGGQVGGIEVYNDLVRIFGLECAQFHQMKTDLIFEEELELEACDPELEQYLPRLGVHWLEPSENEADEKKFDFVLKYYAGENSPVKFSEWMNEVIPDYSTHLKSNEEVVQFMGKNPEQPYKLLIFSRQEYSQKITKNLAAIYLNEMDVGYIDCNDIDEEIEEIMKKFKVLEFPTILIIQDFSDSNMEVMQYDKFINYGLIVEFLKLNIEKNETIAEQEDEPEEIEEDSFEDEEGVILIDDQNYEYYIFQENKAVILHVNNGQEKYHLWKKCRETYKNEFIYAEINCDDMRNEFLCERIFQSPTMPSLIYFTPTTEEKRTVMHFFEYDDLLQADIDDVIYDSFSKYLDKAKQLENYDEAEQLIVKVIKEQTVCVLYMHKWNQIPLGYLVLGVNIQPSRNFYMSHFKNPSSEFLSQFNMQYERLPILTIFGMTDQNIKDNKEHEEEKKLHATFSNFKGNYSYDDIEEFIREEIPQFLVPLRGEKQFKQKIIYQKSDFVGSCGASNHLINLCIIVFYDGSQKHEKYGKHFDFFQQAIKNMKASGTNFIVMDGSVHSEALGYFNYSQKFLPLIAAYKPKTMEAITPEERINFKTQTIKKFIYSVIEEDWDLIVIEQDIPLDTLILHNVREFYATPKEE